MICAGSRHAGQSAPVAEGAPGGGGWPGSRLRGQAGVSRAGRGSGWPGSACPGPWRGRRCPAYRDLDDPGAALFHISVEDMDTAMGWFRSDTFKEATRLAKVTSRHFYLAQPQT